MVRTTTTSDTARASAEGAVARRRANPDDRINNGADDDGSGTVAIMAIARAFAQGPTAEAVAALCLARGRGERASWARATTRTIPSVPIDKIVTQLNMDMVGRNRNDDPKQANTVLVVGSDRISTELHNLNEDANASLAKPMTMDYEMNDPADTESIYTRSDHYSYAAKGIPIVFYFTRAPSRLPRAERQRGQDHLRQDPARRRNWRTRPAAAWRTWITPRCGTTKVRGRGRR